jgi:hypothetical protein
MTMGFDLEWLDEASGQVRRVSAGNPLPAGGPNREGELLPAATRTATATAADQTNANGRGVILYLDVTAASGSGGLTVQIQGKDPSSGKYKQLNVNPTAVVAAGTTAVALYPGASTTGGLAQATAQALPRTWRVVVSHGDASSYTYSLGYSLIV